MERWLIESYMVSTSELIFNLVSCLYGILVGALSGSWGSSIHSIHDASPTFDLSVEGFQLDKVKSFIAAGDGDDQSLRTGRSFSCGKRPSEQRNSSRSGLAAGQGSGRVRAYSVGSQANHAATLAAAAKKRTQQNQQQDVLGTPTSGKSIMSCVGAFPYA